MTWPVFAVGDKVDGASFANAKAYVDAQAAAAAAAAILPQTNRPRLVLRKNGSEALGGAGTWMRPLLSITPDANENNTGSTVFDFSMIATERRVKIVVAGLYLLSYRWNASISPTGGKVGLMMTGGNTALSEVLAEGGSPGQRGSVADVMRCSANDYVGCELLNGSGGAGSANGHSTTFPHQFSIVRLGN